MLQLLRFGLLTEQQFFLHHSTIEISFLLHGNRKDINMIFEGRIGPERTELAIAASNSALFFHSVQKDGATTVHGLKLTRGIYPFYKTHVTGFKEIAFKKYPSTPISPRNKGRPAKYHNGVLTFLDTSESYYLDNPVRDLLSPRYKSGIITIIRYDYTLQIHFDNSRKILNLQVDKKSKE